MAKSRAYYHVLVALAVFSWASSFAVVRGLALRGCDPYLISFTRTAMTALFFLLLLLFQGKRPDLKGLKANFPVLFAMGFAGTACFYLLSNIGLQYTDAGKSTLINSIGPGLTVLLGAIIFKERLTKRRVWGLIISLFGVLIVLFTSNQGLYYKLDFHPIDLVFLATGLTATIYTVFNRLLGDKIDYIAGLFWAYLIASLVLLPSGAAHLEGLADFGPVQWLELLYLSVVPGALANLVWYYALMFIGLGSCGLISSFSPLFGVIIAWLFLGEPLTPVILIGALVLTYGVWQGVSVLPERKRIDKEPERESE